MYEEIYDQSLFLRLDLSFPCIRISMFVQLHNQVYTRMVEPETASEVFPSVVPKTPACFGGWGITKYPTTMWGRITHLGLEA